MNEKAFQRFLATGEYAIAEDAAIQGLEQESSATSVEEEDMETVSDAADKYLALDEKPLTDLQKHDRRFHPKGYKEGDRCRYRETLAAKDVPDWALIGAEEKEEEDLIRASEAGLSLAEKRKKRIAEAQEKGEPLSFIKRRDAGLKPLYYCLYDDNDLVEDYCPGNSNLGDSEDRAWIGSDRIHGVEDIPNEVTDRFIEYARSHGGGTDKAVETPKELSDKGYLISRGRRKNELKLMKALDEPDAYGNMVHNLKFSWRPKNVPRKKPEPKKAEVKETKKASYTPSISLSGALPFPDMHFVVKEPGSREVMMSDGTFKPYEKLSGWDHPLMTTKEHAEEVAKEKGGAAVSDKYLRDTTKWYWIRDNDKVLNSYSAWGPTQYAFVPLGNLSNSVFKTDDLERAQEIAAKHGGKVESAPPNNKWDYRYDRRVYEGYEDVKPQQTEEQKAVQEKLQPKIDAILKKHDVPCEEVIVLRGRGGGGDEFSISLIGKMDKDAQSTPDYISLRKTSASKTVDALRDISSVLAKEGYRERSERFDSLDTLMWRKEKLDDGTLVFFQNFSSPKYIQWYNAKFH